MNIVNYLKSHLVLSSGILIIAIVTTVIGGRLATRSNNIKTNESNIKKVSLVDVSNFRDNLSKVSAEGIVESVSQADLKSQISAPLASVNFNVGDDIKAGQTIAVLQNADIRAQLDQARAGLQLIQSGSGISLESAQKSAIDTIQNSYLTVDETLNIKLAQFLYKDTDGSANIVAFMIEQKLGNQIRNLYIQGLNNLPEWKKSIDSINTNPSTYNIQKALTLSQKNLNNLTILLDTISQSINEYIKNTPGTTNFTLLGNSGWQSTVSLARTSVSTAVKTLTTTQTTWSNSQIDSNSPASAQISSATAIVKNLEAQLAKTIIVSPITGKIAALPLRTGELAQPGQLIATVVGGGGLQIKAYASSEDFGKIKTGSKVLIENSITGKVINVAPSINQINKKIEIRVSVDNNESSGLVIGQNVSISIDADNNSNNSQNATNNYILPVQNIKIIPGNAFVLTVINNKIVNNPVTLGKIQGDFIEVIDGIDPDMKIVSPVYELEEGEQVTVQ